MAEKFRSLLPPSAFHEERSQEQATREQILSLDADMVRNVKNPDTCPIHLLPWLAWEFAVDYWEPAWSEGKKRQVIKDAAYVHQHRGTAGAVRRSLSSVGFPTTIVEWWEENPRRIPYTFRVEVYAMPPIPNDLYDEITRLVEGSKNLRSALTGIDVIAEVGANGVYYMAGAVTGHIDIDIPAGGE
ncbi:phage tail protein I [Serratia bockelmannii]|uniref:phage tail protein I n=1 Tax=Serratia bockelmannii TaxID=2703793 RepID=UPI003FA73894